MNKNKNLERKMKNVVTGAIHGIVEFALWIFEFPFFFNIVFISNNILVQKVFLEIVKTVQKIVTVSKIFQLEKTISWLKRTSTIYLKN